MCKLALHVSGKLLTMTTTQGRGRAKRNAMVHPGAHDHPQVPTARARVGAAEG